MPAAPAEYEPDEENGLEKHEHGMTGSPEQLQYLTPDPAG
jgi:hypothetical protein